MVRSTDARWALNTVLVGSFSKSVFCALATILPIPDSALGLYAPKGTPADVLNKLNTALRNALKDPELVKRQEALGISVISDNRQTPTEHKKFFNAEVARWSKVFSDAGIQPE